MTKNIHAQALGRQGGLKKSEAKRRANKENGRKGGLKRWKGHVKKADLLSGGSFPHTNQADKAGQ